MKRIILSAGSIAFVAALALGVTGAFFTDQEKSTGNTFTAGTLDLQVDSTSHYAGLVCHQVGVSTVFHWIDDPADPTPTTRPDLIDTNCDGTWVQQSLGPNNKFFNFTDIKPGDNGEDTISLHTSNNAWICANITTTANDDNTHLAPETAAGDVTPGPIGQGELAQNTFLFGWIDNASTSGAVAGDNKWQASETVLFQPTALTALVGNGLNLPLADSQHGSALIASTTNYVAVAWCVGTMDVSVPGTIKCDGSTVGNEIQTDSATADITLTATQSRNNPSFLCGQAATSTPPGLGHLIVIKHVVHSGIDSPDSSITAANFQIHVASSSGEAAGSPQPGAESPGTTYNLQPATYTVSETGPVTPQGVTLTTTFSGGCNLVPTVGVLANATSTCTITNTYSAAGPHLPFVGAKLTDYVAPTGGACNVTVDHLGGANPQTIAAGIAVATAGQTVCVVAGTYPEDVNVNKSITLAGAGPTSIVNGQTPGFGGTVTLSADNITLEGFAINGIGGSLDTAVYLTGVHTGDLVKFNTITSGSALANAFLTDGGQSNHTISNNVFAGASAQLVYVNGNADVSVASTNVDFTSNTFSGSATGALLGNNANGSAITLNKFTGTAGGSSFGTFEGNNVVNQNNFDVDLAVGPIHVSNSVNGNTQFPGTLNAENNWWGDTDPSDNTTGLVDSSPSEVTPFAEN